MTAMIYALGAAASVTLCETLFAASPEYVSRLWLFAPLAVLTNWLIFRLVHASPTLLDSLILFSFGTMVLRILSTLFILRQTVTPGAWLGVALILAANVARAVWR